MAAGKGGHPVALLGAPDSSIGFSEEQNKTVQVMRLIMNNDLLEELLNSTRAGKQPQLHFGRNTELRFGNKIHSFDSHISNFRQELYKSKNGNMEFAGLVSHSLVLRKAEEASAGMDVALEAFRNNMASIEQEHEARKAGLVPSPNSSKKSSQTRLAPSHLRTSKPSSLDPSDTKSTPRLGTPSHNSNEDQDRTDAIRYALVHLLAIRPADLKSISRKLHAKPGALHPILKRIAEEDKSGMFTLTNKTYKEIEPWDFRYPSEDDRQAVIDNAIRAFDRLRIDSKDDMWQKLLPVSERGQGKTLSKLKLQAPKASTPMVKATKVLDKKAGPTKRVDTKKTDKSDKPGDNKPAEKTESKPITKPKPKNTEPTLAKKSLAERREAAKRREEDNRKEQERRKAIQAAKSTSSSASSHDSKASAQSKALLNKPKNPSPLSASPPVNASDFDESHHSNKPLNNGVRATKMNGTTRLKRPAEDLNTSSVRQSLNKKPRTDSPSLAPRARPLPPKPTASKRPPPDDSSSSSLDNTPLKIRRMVNGDSVRGRSGISGNSKSANRQQPLSTVMVHSSDDSSGASPDFSLSWRQRLDLAEKFQRFYGRYKKFYMELKTRSEPPSSAQREKLADMHKKLAEMKQQLSTGSLRA